VPLADPTRWSVTTRSSAAATFWAAIGEMLHEQGRACLRHGAIGESRLPSRPAWASSPLSRTLSKPDSRGNYGGQWGVLLESGSTERGSSMRTSVDGLQNVTEGLPRSLCASSTPARPAFTADRRVDGRRISPTITSTNRAKCAWRPRIACAPGRTRQPLCVSRCLRSQGSTGHGTDGAPVDQENEASRYG